MTAKTIGSGAYGQVWAYPEERIAVKIISVSKDGLSNLQSAIREIHVLKYESKYIVPLETIDYRYGSIEIHMDQMTIDLSKQIRSVGLKSIEINSILTDCLHGLQFLHTHNITHRDVKPSNILLNITNDRIRAKLCDFGLSRQFSNELHRGSDYMVTRWYRAPEIIHEEESYGLAIDMWAMGCIIYQMIHRKPLLPLRDAKDLDDRIKYLPSLLNTISDPTLKKLSTMMLKRDPSERWTAKQSLLFMKESPEETSVQRYYDKDIILTEDYKYKFQELLNLYDMDRVLMHAMILFNGTPQTEFDFHCSIIVSFLLFESDTLHGLFSSCWERNGMSSRKVARWVSVFMNKFPHSLSQWEKTKDVEAVMEQIFIFKESPKKKKRKL